MGKGMVQKNETATLLFSWFLAGWLLYEFSPSKLPAYVIAAHVPFAIMIALQLGKGIPFKTVFDKIFTTFHFLIQFVLSLALCSVPFYLQLPQNISLLLSILGLILMIITVFIIIKRNHHQLHFYQMCGALLFILSAWTVAPQITQLINSSKRVALVIGEKEPHPNHVFIGHNFGEQPSLPYYLLTKGCEITDATQYTPAQLFEKSYAMELNVFILSKEQYDFFCQQVGRKIHFESVKSLIIDRKETADYYIVSSPSISSNTIP
jgi:hypothetical protein